MNTLIVKPKHTSFTKKTTLVFVWDTLQLYHRAYTMLYTVKVGNWINLFKGTINENNHWKTLALQVILYCSVKTTIPHIQITANM